MRLWSNPPNLRAIYPSYMNATRPALLMQRWNAVQYDVLPELRADVGVVTPRLERVIYVLEWARIEEFADSWDGIGQPPHVRAWLANAFVAKAVLGITTTVGLVERLTMDKTLRRICGLLPFAKLPSEATFSRAFAEFAEAHLVERAYEAMIKEHLGDQLIGHISRDGTAITARERPAAAANAAPTPAPRKKSKRKGKRPVKQATPAAGSPIRRQLGQTCPTCLRNCPPSATAAPSATRRATRPAGMGTSCTLTPPIVAFPSPPCCVLPRCMTAAPLCRGLT